MFPTGMDASVSVKPKETDMFARLQDIIVTNVDLLSIHKKVIKNKVSISKFIFVLWVSDAFICSVYMYCLSCVRYFYRDWT